MRYLSIMFAAMLLMACGSNISDLQQFVVQVKTSTAPQIEPYPEFHQIPAFNYAAQNERNPFVRPRNQQLALQDQRLQNCIQPDVRRAKSPLEAFGIDALAVQGFFKSKGRNWVLITANDGSLHRAKVGDYLGLFFGRITRITTNTVYFVEQLPDGAGCWKEKQSKLTMSGPTGEGDNV